MTNLQINSALHITVGTAITPGTGKTLDSALDASREFRLLKAALLYADRVTLCSFAPTSLLSLMQRPKEMTEDERLDWFLDFYKNLEHEPNIEKIVMFVDEFKASRSQKQKNPDNYIKYRKAFAKSLSDLDAMAKRAGIEEFTAALKSGVVDFESYTVRSKMDQFIPRISSALASGNTYLLLDEHTGNLVDLAVKAQKIIPLGTSISRAKQAGLSSDLFSRLPLFDQASIDEILDIRKELSKSLIRFRAGVVGFSKEIESVPWDKEFPQETEQVFIEHVQPAVLEIEEAYKSNRLLLKFIGKFSDKPLNLLSSSALGLLISQASQLPAVISQTLSLSAGAAVIALDAVKDWREKNLEIEKNQLYFYYKTGKLL